MSKTSNALQFTALPVNNRRLAHLCGPHNENLTQIAKHLGVNIRQRSNVFSISGESSAIKQAYDTLQTLYQLTENESSPINPKNLFLLLKETKATTRETIKMNTKPIHTKRHPIAPRGRQQEVYVDCIRHYDINFGIGPAGTGKTYLAVACAIEALEKGYVQRLIFVRPAVEAGEKLGFLPGDIEEKVLPYLRPVYDALYDMLGCDVVAKLVEQNIIEIAPLAFMRGRTLNDAFIILDEGQNTTTDQMKMFLTRIGFGSTAVITGDVTQTDLKGGELSGLLHATEVLKDIEGITFTYFTAEDAVRHQLIQTIIQAYERHSR